MRVACACSSRPGLLSSSTRMSSITSPRSGPLNTSLTVRTGASCSTRSPPPLYGDQEILNGVEVVSLPGHTPGTTGVLLHLEHTGAVFLTDDAMYTHETYGPPAVGTPMTWDVPRWNA